MNTIPTPSHPPLKTLLDEFAAYTRDIRSATPATTEAYLFDLGIFIRALNLDLECNDPIPLDKRTLIRFVSFLRSRENTESTIERRLNGLMAFWNFLHHMYDYPPPMKLGECGIRLKKKRRNPAVLRRSTHAVLLSILLEELNGIE